MFCGEAPRYFSHGENSLRYAQGGIACVVALVKGADGDARLRVNSRKTRIAS